ncbi:globin-like [Babylonia areolata]|uniref:globin-like n=1 Tax=Babylonia areolata TaxID=304850 RepID=UPI003FD641F4
MSAPTLTSDELGHIAKSWGVLSATPDAMKENGALLFTLFFSSYGEAKAIFEKEVPGFKPGDMKSDLGRAHSMAVFSGLDAFVKSASDPGCMKGLSAKLSRNHLNRNVSHKQFEEMIKIFPDFLDKALKAEASKPVKDAWHKLLTWLKDDLRQAEGK